jgi:hypothetical protein
MYPHFCSNYGFHRHTSNPIYFKSLDNSEQLFAPFSRHNCCYNIRPVNQDPSEDLVACPHVTGLGVPAQGEALP